MSKGGSCHKFLPAVAGKHELRTLAQIDEPPYDVIQQSAQRGPLGDTWYNHLGKNYVRIKALEIGGPKK